MDQEIREWRSWQLYAPRSAPGSRLQLRIGGVCGWLPDEVRLHPPLSFARQTQSIDRLDHRLVNPYVAPVLHIRRPGSDSEETHHFAEDDPFFSEVSVLIDNIEDIEEDPDTAQILCPFEGVLVLFTLPLPPVPRYLVLSLCWSSVFVVC